MSLYESIKNLVKKISIKNQIIFGFSIYLAFLSLFIYLYFPNIYKEQAIEEAKKRAYTITNLTIYAISPSLIFGDKEALNESMKRMISSGDIYYIVLKNNQDSIIYSHFLNRALETGYSNFPQKYDIDFSNNLIKINFPIEFENKLLGNIYIGYSIDDVVLKYTESKNSILLISLGLLLLGITTSFLISLFITKPILRLIYTIHSFGQGDFSSRVHGKYPPETMELVNSFNNLFDKLEIAYKELNDEIEARTKSEQALIKAKEDLARALEQEKELNELRSRFISMVSHEYRTPLTVILSSTYLLEIFYKQQNEEGFKKQISLIQSSVRDMTNLLDDVLTMGRFDSNQMQLEYKKYDIISLIYDLILQFEMTDKDKHKINFIKDTEKLIIDTDSRLIKHIVNNLISNALKYSPPESEIDVIIKNNTNHYSITVKDKGIGISETEQKFLFQPFFRSKNVSEISGTGLGLTIVKRCVDKLGGTITVESKVNEGTTFEVKLPKKINL